jgi:hypothetical protein
MSLLAGMMMMLYYKMNMMMRKSGRSTVAAAAAKKLNKAKWLTVILIVKLGSNRTCKKRVN